MAIVGTFHITGSFTLTGRGLVAMGDLISGGVKVGNYITFDTGDKKRTLMIGSVGMGRATTRETDYVGLTFVYQDDDERRQLEGVRLAEQDANIMDSPDLP